MTISWRTSALADRHRALGSKLEDWNGMGSAWTYTQDIQGDHAAIRTAAGIMDVSGLKKFHFVGPHAAGILDKVTTRDVSKIYPGKSAYACMLNDSGKFIEDCILYRTGPNAWMVVHGGGAGQEVLAPQVVGRNVAMLFDDNMHDLSLQGPKAVDYLAKHIPEARDLKYFHHIQTSLFGKPIMLSRTGYSGERGYEIFCRAEDAGTIWDTIVDEGKAMGIVPAQFATLDMVRVESYLLFYPYDNSETYPFENGDPPGDSLWELGLDFTVSPGKTGFVGGDAHYRLKGKERFKIFGVLVEGKVSLLGGDELYADGKKIGVITGGMYSSLTKKSMALARFDVAAAVQGKKIEVRGKSYNGPAIAHTLPFDDPDKKKRSAKGKTAMPREQLQPVVEIPEPLKTGSGAPGTVVRTLEQAIGAQIRLYRKLGGLTVADLAGAAGISTGMLSKIENGQISPSLTTLQILSKALNLPMTILFSAFEEKRDCSYVESGHGVIIQRRGTKVGHQYQLLGHSLAGEVVVEPYLITLSEDAVQYTAFQHDGTEFIYMLSGEMIYAHADRTYHMKPGDAMLFDSGTPHGPEALISFPMTYLSIIIYPRV